MKGGDGPAPSLIGHCVNYLARLRSRAALCGQQGEDSPSPTADWWTCLQAFCGSFLGILTLSGLNYHLDLQDSDLVMLTGSFGAQAVLLFAAPKSPLAQPWNCVFGNLISSFIGVCVYKFFKNVLHRHDSLIYLASALSVSLAIVAMLRTRSLHPPAGATSLIAVVGSDKIHHMGFWYMLFPAVVGSALHVMLGILLNNISSKNARMYPTIWSPIFWRIKSKSCRADQCSGQEESSNVQIDNKTNELGNVEFTLVKKSDNNEHDLSLNEE